MRSLLLSVAALLGISVVAESTGAGGVLLAGTASAGGRPEANAVVWLESPPDTPAPEQRRVVLVQRNLSFLPHVLAVRLGTTVEFPNDDRVFHNVFSFHDGKKFDLGLYPVGSVRRVTFDKPGLSRIFCNIHPNMAAYVMVVASPYFSVSNADGRFEIPSVVPASYTYHAWRPGGATLAGIVDLSESVTLAVEWR